MGIGVVGRERRGIRAPTSVGLSVGIAGIVAIFLVRALTPAVGPWSLPNRVQDLLTLSISVIIESLPFVILGIMLSILVQVWVPDRWIMRILPRNAFLRRAMISFLGIFLPVCECGNVPLARGLIVKGFTVSESMTFLLAAPIVSQPDHDPDHRSGFRLRQLGVRGTPDGRLRHRQRDRMALLEASRPGHPSHR